MFPNKKKQRVKIVKKQISYCIYKLKRWQFLHSFFNKYVKYNDTVSIISSMINCKYTVNSQLIISNLDILCATVIICKHSVQLVVVHFTKFEELSKTWRKNDGVQIAYAFFSDVW